MLSRTAKSGLIQSQTIIPIKPYKTEMRRREPLLQSLKLEQLLLHYSLTLKVFEGDVTSRYIYSNQAKLNLCVELEQKVFQLKALLVLK